MRPFALVAILAALCGCSLNYQGKTFSAIEKPHHMAEGQKHEINGHGMEEEESKSQGDTLTEGAGTVGSGAQEHRMDVPTPEGATPPQVPASSRRIGSVFPSTAQPTGRPPVMEAAPSEAGPASEPVHK